MISAGSIAAIFPLLRRYALARPNARSSHRVPTPQGAGLAVIATTLIVAAIAAPSALGASFAALTVAALLLMAVGAIDDLRPMPVLPRLVLQVLATGLVLVALPAGVRVLPWLPLEAERTLLLLAGLWFINLVNFMDGIDWLTVAEIVPITACLVLLTALGAVSTQAAAIAGALCGAMIGFAPYNSPVAKVFLGDVGSLPAGLLLGWCLIDLAANGGITAALLLPLYYLVDATVTLLRRLRNGDKVWLAHRSHFYQRATDNGFAVIEIVRTVFVLNLVLAALAVTAVILHSHAVNAGVLVLGAAAVAFVLLRFAKPRALSRRPG